MSIIVIAGGHGQIALRLARLLSARGDTVRSLIRNPGHEAGVHAAGAEAVLADMEQLDDLSGVVDGADAVVFAAGAGPGSGAERKRTVDLGAAVKLLDAARRTGARRYLMVSSMGAGDPTAGGDAITASFLREAADLAQVPGSSFYRRLRQKFGRLSS